LSDGRREDEGGKRGEERGKGKGKISSFMTSITSCERHALEKKKRMKRRERGRGGGEESLSVTTILNSKKKISPK